MNRYTIYCTPEQTRKALELGAPIELLNYEPTILQTTITLKGYAIIPTAEQMIGWLEEYVKEVSINQSVIGSWYFEIYINPHEMKRKNCGYLTRKEATIAAIDDSLEYLSQNKVSPN